MQDRKEQGRTGETAAASFLEEQGVQILYRNYRCRLGEIDIIGREGDTLLVVEVKTRKSRRQGRPSEAVDWRKQQKICRVYDCFRMRHRLDDYVPVRFDVVEVDSACGCHWIKNAFEYQEM